MAHDGEGTAVLVSVDHPVVLHRPPDEVAAALAQRLGADAVALGGASADPVVQVGPALPVATGTGGRWAARAAVTFAVAAGSRRAAACVRLARRWLAECGAVPTGEPVVLVRCTAQPAADGASRA